MNNFISIEEREVTPKGLAQTEINAEKLQSYFFADDFELLSKLNALNVSIKETPTLFYPGCGADIFFPLLYVEKLFPQLQKINLVFVDTQECMNLILTQLDDVNVSFSQISNVIQFYWKQLLVTLEFVQNDVFTMQLPSFDIYFERAFRIMKSEHPDFEHFVYNSLNPNGIVISDNGFQFVQKRLRVPKELSGYGDMVVAVKS